MVLGRFSFIFINICVRFILFSFVMSVVEESSSIVSFRVLFLLRFSRVSLFSFGVIFFRLKLGVGKVYG